MFSFVAAIGFNLSPALVLAVVAVSLSYLFFNF
jgi:hypothetical protein